MKRKKKERGALLKCEERDLDSEQILMLIPVSLNEICSSCRRFPRQVIEENGRWVKCFLLERDGNLCMQNRRQCPFSTHPQDSSSPGNAREAGFSGVVAYRGRESD